MARVSEAEMSAEWCTLVVGCLSVLHVQRHQPRAQLLAQTERLQPAAASRSEPSASYGV